MKLKKTYETECYISQSGYYIIKQEDDLNGECLVFLSPQQVQHVVNDMTQSLIDPSWWDEEDDV